MGSNYLPVDAPILALDNVRLKLKHGVDRVIHDAVLRAGGSKMTDNVLDHIEELLSFTITDEQSVTAEMNLITGETHHE